MPLSSSVPRCWRLEQWPAIDREALLRGFEQPEDPFGPDSYGPRLREASRVKLIKDHGRWLDFLHARGWLDPVLLPLDRVDRPRLRAYFRELRRSGNADRTIISRFAGLTMAMRVMAPGRDVSWIRRPDGTTIYALLPKRQRSLPIPETDVLYAWGMTMMDEAPIRSRPIERLTAFRDGLIIAMLAACGRRLRSMALLRAGYELVWRDGHYRVELDPTQVKTRKPDRVDLPASLTSYIRHYLHAVRPALLAGQREDDLWINKDGAPLGEAGIQHRLVRLTKRRFGFAFGPHRFRHSIVTTAALHMPDIPHAGAALLGISLGVAEEHYNRAGSLPAGTRYMDLMEEHLRVIEKGKRR